MSKNELYKGLTKEQYLKVKSCKTTEELMAVAKAEGVELTDEQLEVISGGGMCSTLCPDCASSDLDSSNFPDYHCNHCGLDFDIYRVSHQ